MFGWLVGWIESRWELYTLGAFLLCALTMQSVLDVAAFRNSVKCSLFALVSSTVASAMNGLCVLFDDDNDNDNDDNDGLYTLRWLSHSSLYLSLVLWNFYSNFAQNHFNFMHWCHSKNSVVVALYIFLLSNICNMCLCVCVFDLDIFNGFTVIQSGRKWINCNNCRAHVQRNAITTSSHFQLKFRREKKNIFHLPAIVG